MRVYTLPDGRQLNHGQAFTLDDIKYPANWLEKASLDDLNDRGILMEEVPDPDPEPPSLEDVKADLLSRIDRTAEDIRLRYITPGSGQALTYDRKRREAAAAIVDPAPDADKYPVLAASIGIEVPSTGNLKTDFDAIANIVLAREEQWAGIAYHVELRRLGGKRAIEAAQTIEDAQAAFDAVDWSGL